MLSNSNTKKLPLKDWVVTLINLKTGETIQIDRREFQGRELKKGFVIAEELSVEKWIAGLRSALNKR